MYRLLVIILWPLVKIFFPTKFVGRKNIKKKENYIFVCNHRSNMDAVILATGILRKQRFLTKRELIKKPIIGPFIKCLSVIPIDRHNVGIESVKLCLKALKNNQTLTIFPEGTRANSDTISEVKNGAAMLAIKTNTKIIPIYIKKKSRLFCQNKVVIGEAFSLESFAGEKLTKDVLDKASEVISDKLLEISK